MTEHPDMAARHHPGRQPVKVIVGTYRKQAYIGRALASIEKHLTGATDIVFVDDSGDTDHAAWLRQYGQVIETHASGYNAAMNAVCTAMGDDAGFFFEEDFELLEPVDLNDMMGILTARPYLAQLALLRGPHFPIEHEHGGLLEALSVRIPGSVDGDVDGVIEQTGTFTCNPALWAPGIAARGWPEGRWSEDRKRDQLLAEGFRFGFLPDVKVAHDGIRSGKGY